jgi:hypothetical protein
MEVPLSCWGLRYMSEQLDAEFEGEFVLSLDGRVGFGGNHDGATRVVSPRRVEELPQEHNQPILSGNPFFCQRSVSRDAVLAVLGRIPDGATG